MPQNPRSGYGALLQVGDGLSPETYTTILGVKNISGPEITRETYDTTQMDGDGWRTFIGGLNDAGEITFDANWLPLEETQGQSGNGWMAQFDKESCESLTNLRLVLPTCPDEDEIYLEMQGVVTGQSVQVPMDDLMSFSGTLKVSGRPDLVIVTA